MLLRDKYKKTFNTYDAHIDYDTKTTKVIDKFYEHFEDDEKTEYEYIKLHTFYFPYGVNDVCTIFSVNITIQTNARSWGAYDSLKYTISDSLRFYGTNPEITLTELKSDYIYWNTYCREGIFDKYIRALITESKVMGLKYGESKVVKVSDYLDLRNEKGKPYDRPRIRAQGKIAREQGYGRTSEYYITEFEFKKEKIN